MKYIKYFFILLNIGCTGNLSFQTRGNFPSFTHPVQQNQPHQVVQKQIQQSTQQAPIQYTKTWDESRKEKIQSDLEEKQKQEKLRQEAFDKALLQRKAALDAKTECYNKHLEEEFLKIKNSIKIEIESMWILNDLLLYKKNFYSNLESTLSTLKLLLGQQCNEIGLKELGQVPSSEVSISLDDNDRNEFNEMLEKQISCLNDAKCVEDHKQEIFNEYLRSFSDICLYSQSIKNSEAAMRFERSNPSGYVNKTTLYEHGQNIQLSRISLKELQTQFYKLTNKNYPMNLCKQE